MTAAWSEASAFGELRSLVSGRPSEGAFSRVCDVIDEAEEAAPGLHASRWREYVASQLERWPASMRVVGLPRESDDDDLDSYRWRDELRSCWEASEGAWSELVRGVTLRAFDLTSEEMSGWLARDLREIFPLLEHLGFAYLFVRKKELERACEAGVFDGLSSLSISDGDLRPTTFETFMGHLERLGTLRRLELESCRLGPHQLERLCLSSLVPGLEVLSLSGNGSLKNEGFGHLAEAAPRFESLRELRLDWLTISAKSAVALAGADWAPTLERISFENSGIKGTGLKGFVDAGRIGLLAREVGGVVSLDLANQELKDRGVVALACCEELTRVESLSLFGNGITKLARLASSPYIEDIRGWDLSGNEFADEEARHVLAIALRSRPRALALNGMMLGDAFLVDLFAMGESSELEALNISTSPGYGAAGLEALLDWPRLSELTGLQCVFRVERETELVARALATGLFETTNDNPYTGLVRVVAKPGAFDG